jgi:hypothetical protein
MEFPINTIRFSPAVMRLFFIVGCGGGLSFDQSCPFLALCHEIVGMVGP